MIPDGFFHVDRPAAGPTDSRLNYLSAGIVLCVTEIGPFQLAAPQVMALYAVEHFGLGPHRHTHPVRRAFFFSDE